MYNRLGDRMTWEQVCEHTYNQAEHLLIKPNGKPYKKKDFIEWMLSKRSINDGQLAAGVGTYAYCFKVSMKINTQEQDHFTVVTGQEGSGKSWTAAVIAALVSPTFSTKHIVYDPGMLAQAYGIGEKGDSILIDEGALFLYSRSALSSANVDITKIFTVIRAKQLHTIICIPQFKHLDSQVRQNRVNTIVYKHDLTYCRYIYSGAKREAFSILNKYYPKKYDNILHVKLPVKFWYDDRINNCFPNINDLNSETYKRHKLKYLEENLSKVAEKHGIEPKNPYNTTDYSINGGEVGLDEE